MSLSLSLSLSLNHYCSQSDHRNYMGMFRWDVDEQDSHGGNDIHLFRGYNGRRCCLFCRCVHWRKNIGQLGKAGQGKQVPSKREG